MYGVAYAKYGLLMLSTGLLVLSHQERIIKRGGRKSVKLQYSMSIQCCTYLSFFTQFKQVKNCIYTLSDSNKLGYFRAFFFIRSCRRELSKSIWSNSYVYGPRALARTVVGFFICSRIIEWPAFTLERSKMSHMARLHLTARLLPLMKEVLSTCQCLD